MDELRPMDPEMDAIIAELVSAGLITVGWEFIAVRHDARTWSAFRGPLSFATWLAEHTDMSSVTAAVRSGREAAA